MRNLIIFAATVCLAAFLGSGVWPEVTTSQEAVPAGAAEKVLTIPASAFNEQEDGYNFYRTTILYFNAGSGFFYAPVNLPHGSVIKQVILICMDNGSLHDVKLTLAQISRSGSGISIVTVSSSGSDFNHRTFIQKNLSAKVNNRKYSYFLTLSLQGTGSAGYRFSQAKIVYKPPSS